MKSLNQKSSIAKSRFIGRTDDKVTGVNLRTITVTDTCPECFSGGDGSEIKINNGFSLTH